MTVPAHPARAWLRPVLLAVGCVLGLAGCGGDGRVQPDDSAAAAGFVSGAGVVTIVEPAQRAPAPDFGGPTLDGGQFRLAEHVGAVVVLNVWGSWCPPCRQEAPALAAVAQATAAQGVQFVGVNVRDPVVDLALAYEREFGIGYPSVVDTDGVRLLAFRESLPPAAIPSTLVVDRSGRIAARVLGPITEASLQDLVGTIAAEPV